MADPHVILAPIIEPPLPPVASSVPAPAVLMPWVLIGAALLLAVLALWWWQRRAPARALRRMARAAEAQQGARQLAHWQARHWPQAPAQWRQALERLRFGPADADAAAALRGLYAEAERAWRAR